MDTMQHGKWVRLNNGYNFLMIKFGKEGVKLSVLVKSQLCLSGEMKSEFNANHVYGGDSGHWQAHSYKDAHISQSFPLLVGDLKYEI
jgi:hypothetical protein